MEGKEHFFWLIPLVSSSLDCQNFKGKRNLNVPYLPHGRADRVFEKGNPLPLREVLWLFKKFDHVTITDPHSWSPFKLFQLNPNANTTIQMIPQRKCF